MEDISRNILDFLRRKAAHGGHTYWLVKVKGAEYVSLYDLTSLSMKEEQIDMAELDRDESPFKIPLGMLFYKVFTCCMFYICSILPDSISPDSILPDSILPDSISPDSILPDLKVFPCCFTRCCLHVLYLFYIA